MEIRKFTHENSATWNSIDFGFSTLLHYRASWETRYRFNETLRRRWNWIFLFSWKLLLGKWEEEVRQIRSSINKKFDVSMKSRFIIFRSSCFAMERIRSLAERRWKLKRKVLLGCKVSRRGTIAKWVVGNVWSRLKFERCSLIDLTSSSQYKSHLIG